MTIDRERWLADQARITERNARLAAFTRDALDAEAELQPHWRDCVRDLLADLERIVARSEDPDDVDLARSAISTVSGMFGTSEKREAIYLGSDPED